MKPQKKTLGRWYFFLSVILIYLVFLFIDKNIFNDSLIFFSQILMRVLPVFLVVFVLMAFSNYFITPNFIMRHLGEKGFKRWLFTIVGGILSDGPIYLWYPLLANLKEKGLSPGLIACFLYNRAIKIPLIPLAIIYFGSAYVIILTIVMALASILQGIILNKVMKTKIKKKK